MVRPTTKKNLSSMVKRMPRRTQRDILVEDSEAFLARFSGGNRRASPEERRRAIRKRRLKKELKGIARNPVFFEQAHFGNVWKQQRAWTLEKNAFDYELFAQQYERIVKKLLARELTSMNGDGASMKVLPVISFVIGGAGEADTREEYAEILSKGYPQPTWRSMSVHPEQPQYLGLNAGALTYEQHWEVRSLLDLEGLEGTAIHNERDIANYAARLVEGIMTKVTSITYAFFVRGNWLDLKVSKFYSYAGGAARVKLPEYPLMASLTARRNSWKVASGFLASSALETESQMVVNCLHAGATRRLNASLSA